MKRIALERVPIDGKALMRRGALESDTDMVIEEPGIYEINGKPAIIYGRLKQKYDRMVWAVKTVGTSKNVVGRSNPGETKLFGFRSQTPFGKPCCEAASSAVHSPLQHSIICEFGRLLDGIYSTAAPEIALKHSEELSSFRSEWIIPGTRFTSGIINKNNSLNYHYDKGNIFGVMSAMVVFRNLCDGGFLSVPELNARFFIEDHSYFLFDGQAILHGVTPIRLWNSKGYRYSAVYYALRKMKKCGSLVDELNRARVEKRLREKRRCAQ